jgi:hypothetical protein
MNTQQVRIVPWAEGDLGLLRRVNTPQMKRHVGGAETDEQIIARHQRYVDIAATGKGRMFSIVLLPRLEAVGTIGHWERVWQGRPSTRDRLGRPAAIPGQRHRGCCRGRGNSQRPGRAQASASARLPIRRQPRLERDLPQGRLLVPHGVRVRVPTRQLHAEQRLVPGPVGHGSGTSPCLTERSGGIRETVTSTAGNDLRSCESRQVRRTREHPARKLVRMPVRCTRGPAGAMSSGCRAG